MHIPKTAGTSLRRAFENRLPRLSIVKEYGLNDVTTSDVARELLSGKIDLLEFRKRLDATNVELLVGHFKSSTYFDTFADATWITFVREPVSRLFSDWCHFVKHYEYRDSFEAFLQKPERRNMQSKAIGEHTGDFSFIGLTECYEAELCRLSDILGIPLPELRHNVNSDSQRLAMTPEQRCMAEELNAIDIELYREIKSQYKPTHVHRGSIFDSLKRFIRRHPLNR